LEYLSGDDASHEPVNLRVVSDKLNEWLQLVHRVSQPYSVDITGNDESATVIINDYDFECVEHTISDEL
jgi:hypothetical protein